MKITKTRLKEIIKEELEGGAAGKTYSFRIYKYRQLDKGLGDAGTFDFLEDLTFDQLDTEKYERFKDTHARPERFLKPSKEVLAGVEGYNQYEHGVHLMTKPAESYPPKGEYIKSPQEREYEKRSEKYTEGKKMKLTKERLKEIIKEELENVLEGVEKAWCVGFEKDGEMHHERVYADAGGVAERKIKKKHDIGDDAIKSTKEGECKRSVNEARSPRSALAFANQVHETLNSAKPPYSFSGSVKRAGTYDTMRTGYGKFLRKDYFDDGDKPEISTLLYDLRVFPKKKEYLPEPWSSSDLDTPEATLEAVKEILQDAYGPIKKMDMRGRRRGVDAIPVGKYAIVFGMGDTILGISKIL